jgi:hypothetical protein
VIVDILVGLVGFIAGVFVAVVVTAQDHRELRAQNDHLRTALRLSRTWAFHAHHPFLVTIIDRALAEEAGA